MAFRARLAAACLARGSADEMNDCCRPSQRSVQEAELGPAPVEDFRDQAFVTELASWTERSVGLQQWFISSPEHPSQAKLLRARARKAIPDLLAVVALLNERRAGRSDRTADFRELAVWFAQAPDEPAMHRLWQATFGRQLPPPHARCRQCAGAHERSVLCPPPHGMRRPR